MPHPYVSFLVTALRALSAGLCLSVVAPSIHAQLVPTDVGTTVNGFQDDFNGTALQPAWVVRGANAYSVSDGLLHITTAAGDPNHLLCEVAGYDATVQEVLARIRVNSFGSGDPPRAGLSAGVTSANSQGINLMFRDAPSLGQRHFGFLDDARAWGPEMAFAWQNNTWYWLRLRHEPNAAALGGVNDAFAKIWRADGSEAEPANWQMTFDYTPLRTTRTGFAGLAASSTSGTAEFDVDYVLIKAAGLPSIVVSPSAGLLVPVSITSQPQNQTVVEGATATFSVGLSGNPPPLVQWRRNGTRIPDATNITCQIPAVRLSDAGTFSVVATNVITNTTFFVTSSDATLSVNPDVTPPALISAQSVSLTEVQVAFSERVSVVTGTNRSNYQITNTSGAVSITGARLDSTGSNVVLTVGLVSEGAAYTVVVNNIRDTANASNLIAANSTATFVALSFTAAAIGNPQPAGGAVPRGNGLDITAGGRDIGGTNDQFQFHYQARSGDFDVQVRLESLTLVDAWTEAGLVAREDVNGGSRFAGVLATPSISGISFHSRDAIAGPASLAGRFPVNYPATWLRLRRTGNQFTGYAGLDGATWALLGSATVAMPGTILLGLAASSHDTNRTATAAFRDLANVTAAGALASALPSEPLGQSSRRTSLIISEIMFNPLDRADGRNLEFVELYNTLGTPEDISGYRLDGAADYTFPPNTIIPAGAFLVVAQAPADIQAVYGLTGVLGPFANTNSLPNDRGTIQLRHRSGGIFLDASYDTETPWPIAADGAGHSLVLAHPSFGEGRVEAWAASDAVGGSPGRADPVSADPRRAVVINEFLAHTDPPDLDFIELYNHGNQAVDISGCHLSDARNTNKFTFGAGTILPARGFIVVDQNALGFALSSGGERIYFRTPDGNRVLDAVRFEAQANGVSSGRSPESAPEVSELSARSPGAANHRALVRDVVINEILYNPISGNNDDEFIELYNRGSASVSLGGWRLLGGVTFTFPLGTSIPPDGYLVIAQNAARLRSRYPNLNSGNTVGDFNGNLSNSGERIALASPDPFFTTNNNVVTTNFNYVVMDEVNYRDGGRWGQWSDGGGSSLELIDPRSDNRLAANWADSDETAKAPWTTVEVRGTLDNGTVSPDQLQVLLLGAGECLIDDVEVRSQPGTNIVANATFESNATGWTAEGTQEQSSWEPAEGFNSARSFHVRATDRGDNQVNRIRTPLTPLPTTGQPGTIRAKIRWLRGHPEILFRLRGNWLEAAVVMDLPTNLGTPGARNSRAVLNAPPAISAVSHYPPVPAANEPVVVTARIDDPDGVSSPQVRYRLDPSATPLTATMVDNGTGSDAVANDGLYTGVIPPQPAGILVAFRVQATDGFSPPATSTFPNNAPVRECLVRFGESVPPGNLPSYRMWMTQASFNAWDTRNNLNNTLNDVTIVIGNHRVIYNAGAVYAGSPYIGPSFNTPTGNRCGYAIELPSDDRFLGDSALQLDWPGGHGGENTAIQEQMAYWLADRMNVAFSHRYHIRLTVNGVTDMQRGGVFEAVLQPGGNFLEQWNNGDSEGDFFKIDRAFEFSDAGGLTADPQPQLRIYTTPDPVTGLAKKKLEKYRWYWLKRSFASAHDYTNVFAMADALNIPALDNYTAQTEALADVEQWMGIFAAEHIINNFDSWGHEIGKNMYMFFPQNGRARIYMFDLDWLMLVAAGRHSATAGPLFLSEDPTVSRMYNHPPFRRSYFRAVQNAISNAFVTANYEAAMDAKYQSLVANGVTLCDGATLAAPTAVKTWFSQRRTFLVQQLNTVASPFTLLSNGGNDFSTGTNLVTLTGTAPIEIKGLRVNGGEYPITWTSVSNWTLRVVLATGQNPLTIEGYDAAGRVLSNFTARINITSSNTPDSAEGHLVINEIMYRPTVPDADFVEIFNTSATTPFDLAGWRLNGAAFTFPPGSIIEPRGFKLVAHDASAMVTAYGTNAPLSTVFGGQLDPGGETLSLIRPGTGAGGAGETAIDSVTYDDDPPWPSGAATGASLQLIDANQDNRRVSNWSDGAGWRFYSFTGQPVQTVSSFLVFLASAGEVLIDDLQLVDGAVATAGTNYLQNGGFETGTLAPWTAIGNHAQSFVTTEATHDGQYSLHIIATNIGTGNNVVSQPLALATDKTYTFSFWYLPSTNGFGINFRASAAFRTINPLVYRPQGATPGYANSVAASGPPFPPVWLNEFLPENLTGLPDNSGEREPWVELYNAGDTTVSLNGWSLSDSYTNLTRWAFPANTTIGPGQFLVVWLDGEPGESVTDAPHASFRPARTNGSLALSFPVEARPILLDYLNYDLTPADRSIGYYPEDQPGRRHTFTVPTPGGTNNISVPPRRILVNEWMAANTSFLQDLTDSTYDDWFELYNPDPTPADLTGYSLSDRLTGTTGRWTIPDGTIIPPRGFLFFWADEDTGQNGTDSTALHAGFRLSQSGEAIGVFSPDGTLIDGVTFLLQTNNVSQGRWPDGAATIYYMTQPTPRSANVIASQPGEIRFIDASLAPNGDFQMSWTAELGKTYRIQSKDDLRSSTWTDVIDVVGTGAIVTRALPRGGAQRFYRIFRVDP